MAGVKKTALKFCLPRFSKFSQSQDIAHLPAPWKGMVGGRAAGVVNGTLLHRLYKYSVLVLSILVIKRLWFLRSSLELVMCFIKRK